MMHHFFDVFLRANSIGAWGLKVNREVLTGQDGFLNIAFSHLTFTLDKPETQIYVLKLEII